MHIEIKSKKFDWLTEVIIKNDEGVVVINRIKHQPRVYVWSPQ